MGRILIVGAGQSGLQLALGLQSHGRDVTLVSNRTAAEIRSGHVMSTQAMFDTSLQIERDLGLNFWENQSPRIAGLGVSVAGPDAAGDPSAQPAVDFLGRLPGHAQSVDQRVKMAGWLETFEQRGGRVVVHTASVSDLDRLSEDHSLTVVAAGRGELSGLFAADTARSVFDRPQRALAVAYVHGARPRAAYSGPNIHCNLLPGVGELFVIPAYTLDGPCDILFLESVPGGPADVFEDIAEPRRFLDLMKDRIRAHAPWEYDRIRNAELTDAAGVLAGRFTPAVRRPVGTLPSGRPVLGAADVVVSVDPVTGQGANMAARCGAHYLHAILQRGDRPFDTHWMRGVFDRYWDYAKHVVRWTDAMLGPAPEHVQRLLAAAEQLEPVADRIAGGFDDPTDFAEFFFDAADASDYLAKVRDSLGISTAR